MTRYRQEAIKLIKLGIRPEKNLIVKKIVKGGWTGIKDVVYEDGWDLFDNDARDINDKINDLLRRIYHNNHLWLTLDMYGNVWDKGRYSKASYATKYCREGYIIKPDKLTTQIVRNYVRAWESQIQCAVLENEAYEDE